LARSTTPSTDAPRERDRLSALEKRISVLESERPGRKPQPLLAIRQRGICGLDPSRDSAKCKESSIYRYQNGCHGDACREKQHKAYERRKLRKEAEAKKVERAKKRAAKKKLVEQLTAGVESKASAVKATTAAPVKTPAKRTAAPAKRAPRKTSTPSKRPTVSKRPVAKKVTKTVSKRPAA
jgi:hypothetical protein